MKYYLQILLLLAISIGYLVNAENGLLGSDYMDIMPVEEDYENPNNYEYSDNEYEYYDSDSESEEEFFPGSDLSDDEFAGRITNDEVLIQLPSSLEEFDSITITPPSLVDFTAPPDCTLASVLGNNYVDSYQIAVQTCTRELKEQLSLEFNSLQEQVSETKANFQSFLQEYSSSLSQDEMDEVRSQIAALDSQMAERSERMRVRLQNPDCSQYTDVAREEAIIEAVNIYDRVLGVDELLAGDQLFCLENYVRRVQSSLEECQYQIMSLYGPLITEENTDFIYEKMCRSKDVQRVQDIVNDFFTEISHESTYPTPMVEPVEYLEEPDDLAEQMEQRRLEINGELEELQQELDLATTDKESIHNSFVEVSNRRVYVQERISELTASGYSDSDEVRELSDELDGLLTDEGNLKSELSIINQLITELQAEMDSLLAEEIQLETQLGVLPDEEPSSPIDHFISILGPGPVQIEMPTEETDVEHVTLDDTIIDDVPTPIEDVEEDTIDDPYESYPHDIIITDEIYQIDIEDEPEAKHHGPLKYLIGILVGVVLLIIILVTSLCILMAVLMKKRTVKKVPYDRASLSDKDPALLLKQTGFENPIYKFYVENSKREN